ncbi:MAG: hypothetical protein IPM71_03085 [Bacteroidota bacterium]|nr:MAG: hypothetical protein IPM71_03085 [Bacteroidota bacterium]
MLDFIRHQKTGVELSLQNANNLYKTCACCHTRAGVEYMHGLVEKVFPVK